MRTVLFVSASRADGVSGSCETSVQSTMSWLFFSFFSRVASE